MARPAARPTSTPRPLPRQPRRRRLHRAVRLSRGSAGDELVVDFTLLGQRFMGLNGGPDTKPTQAVSFMVETEDQAETDLYWDAILDNGGSAQACGWCTDRWGYSWQITPRVLNDAMASGDNDLRKRAFAAMMTMVKIDVAAIEEAIR
ncbi:VOC family protein [Sphingomonas sp. MMS24-JH45]